MSEQETRVEERQDTREVRSWDAANRCVNCDSLIYQYKQQWYHAYSGYSCCGRMAVAIPAPVDAAEGRPTRTVDCHVALHGRCKRCGLTVEQWTDSVCPAAPTAVPATRDADGPRWCLACGQPTVDPYCKECTERYRAIAESTLSGYMCADCGVDLDDTPDTQPSTPAFDEAAMADVVAAITDMQEGRDSHQQWLDHLLNTKHDYCKGCDDFAAHIGDAEHHQQWIEKYDRVIRLLALVPIDFPPTETTRRYFCSCGATCTAEEYVEHCFTMGHDQGTAAGVEAAAHETCCEHGVLQSMECLNCTEEYVAAKPAVDVAYKAAEEIVDAVWLAAINFDIESIAPIIRKHCTATPAANEEVERLRVLHFSDFCNNCWPKFKNRSSLYCAGCGAPMAWSKSEGRLTYADRKRQIDQLRAELSEARASAIRDCRDTIAESLRALRENYISVNRALEVSATALESLAHEGRDDGHETTST